MSERAMKQTAKEQSASLHQSAIPKIQYNASLCVNNGGIEQSRTTGFLVADQHGVGITISMPELGSDAVAIDTGTVNRAGWVWIKNTDQKRIVEYGPECNGAMVPIGRLLPGFGTAIYLAHESRLMARVEPIGVVPAWASDLGPVRLEVMILES